MVRHSNFRFWSLRPLKLRFWLSFTDNGWGIKKCKKTKKSIFHPKTKSKKKTGGKSSTMKYNFINVMMWIYRIEIYLNLLIRTNPPATTRPPTPPDNATEDPWVQKNKNCYNSTKMCENNVVNMCMIVTIAFCIRLLPIGHWPTPRPDTPLGPQKIKIVIIWQTFVRTM